MGYSSTLCFLIKEEFYMFKGPIPTGPLDVVLAVGAIAFNFWYQHRKEKREKENIKYLASLVFV